MNTMLRYVTTFWKNAFNFNGRTNLEQYFMPAVLNGFVCAIAILAVGIITGIIGLIKPLHGFAGILMGLCSFAISGIFFISSFSATIRRLHDVGRHWYNIFFIFIPIIGIFIFMYFLLCDTAGNALGEPTELQNSNIVIPEVNISFKNENTQTPDSNNTNDIGDIGI